MPGGKENKNPDDTATKAEPTDAVAVKTAGDAEKTDKKANPKRDHPDNHDSIGPGDVEKGIAAVGWKMPCKCGVLQGQYGTICPVSIVTCGE
eukprot:SAG31_NODE_6696_length_1922_cov_1.751509_1_plen_91_part_10